MSIVHRLAWEHIPSQQLKSSPSMPEDSPSFFSLKETSAHSVFSSAERCYTTSDIPPDCRMSTLPEVSVFRSCAWAIKLLLEIMGEGKACRLIGPKTAEVALVYYLGQFVDHDRDHHSRVEENRESYRTEDGARKYSEILTDIELCVDELLKWPQRDGLDWLAEVAHAAVEFRMAQDRSKLLDSEANVLPLWVPDRDVVNPFERARRRLVGEPIDEESIIGKVIVEEVIKAKAVDGDLAPDSPNSVPVSSSAGSPDDSRKPHWDRSERILTYGVEPYKFRNDAHNCMKILDAFESNHWAGQISSPFGTDNTRLKDTVKQLNKSKLLLKFIPISRTSKVKWSRDETLGMESSSTIEGGDLGGETSPRKS